MGKELAVFAHRLSRQRSRLVLQPIEAKINGAVGNYNAHKTAYPDIPWPKVAKDFLVDHLGLSQNPLTTQIENHDSLVELLSILKHLNVILTGLCRDLWSYISIGYFRQKASPHEVGSSTMPHKVNPIDFENAEGNLGLAVGLISHLSEKLPISRWQRDLTDSTVLRSLGVVMGHTELAWKSLQKGLQKIDLDPAKTRQDLDQSWEVLSEPVQTVLRRFGVVDAYERLKAATRGVGLSKQGYQDLVKSCHEIPEEYRKQLLQLEPHRYIGLAEHLAEDFLSQGLLP
jgi:adenylosuccinate lyase